DFHVTGVQTCALPICSLMVRGLYHLYTWADVEYVGRPPAQAPARYRRRARRAGGRARETITPTGQLAPASANTLSPGVAGGHRKIGRASCRDRGEGAG